MRCRASRYAVAAERGKLRRTSQLYAATAPETRAISVFQDGKFRPYLPQSSELPTVSSSVDWYRGWRDHLEFAEIEGHL